MNEGQALLVYSSPRRPLLRFWSLCSVWKKFGIVCFVIIFWSVGILLSKQPSSTMVSLVKKPRNDVGFFHISDIHMDPLYHPIWRKQDWSCRCPPVSSNNTSDNLTIPVWETRSNISQLAYPFGRVGCDSSIFLVESMLQAMKQVCSSPLFVLFTGDLIAHDISQPQLYKATIIRWMDMYRQYFPNTYWIPVVGNNDIFIPSSNNFTLEDMERHVVLQFSQLGQLYFQNSTSHSFETLGSYTFAIDNNNNNSSTGLQVIVYNSLWFTPRFWSKGLSEMNDDDPSEEHTRNNICQSLPLLSHVQQQQVWLRNELLHSTGKVILVSHIPPGWKSSEEYNWCPVFVDWFLSLIREYYDALSDKDMLLVQFYGDHTIDEFRVITQKDNSSSLISSLLIHSGLSSRRPIPGNPSFRWVEIENREWTTPIKDYVVYSFPLQRADWEWKWSFRGLDIPWSLLYRWSELYNISSIQEMARLINKLKEFDWLEKYFWAQTVGGCYYYAGRVECAICDILYIDQQSHQQCCHSLLLST